MNIRQLRPDEWDRLKPIVEAEGGSLPLPENATAAIAEDDEGICGVWIMEFVLHAGPLWVAPRARRTGLWRKLHAFLESLLPKIPKTGYYVFSGSDRTSHICESLGLADSGWKLFKREF